MLAVLLLTGCSETDNPVSTRLEVNTSPLVLSIGESATRAGSSNASDAVITYTSSKPAVATVDNKGTVKAMSEGETTITISMGETVKTYKVIVNKIVSAAAMKDVDKATPLTLVAAEDGKITVYFMNGITLTNDIKYTINGGEEQTISKNTEGSYDIVVKKGDVVQLYSTNTTLGGGGGGIAARATTRSVDDGAKHINIRPSMKTEIYGNVMSLLKGKDNLEDATEIEGKNAFYGLFAGADKLVSSEDRELVLPATTLKEGCYDNMFTGCKNIEKAPELPAPTLVKDCYSGMFAGCSKLSEVKCLATDVSAEGCTDGWLADAGTEAETPPVIEVTPEAKTALAETIPATFTTNIAVTKITLEPTALKLMAGETATLKATIEPEDATNKELQWSSSNLRVATVSPDGLSESLEAVVTAVSAGTATITVCTPDGSVKATCQLTVEAKPEVVPQYYKVWVYGEDPEWEPPFILEPGDASGGRFSYTEGKYLPTLPDEVYFGLKKLIFEITDATEGKSIFNDDDGVGTTARIMNGWWSATYEDDVPLTKGLWELQITEKMANDCAKGGDGKDLILLMTRGSVKISSVYYMEEGEEPPTVLAESISLEPTETNFFYSAARNYYPTYGIGVDFQPWNTSRKYINWTTSNSNVLQLTDKKGHVRPVIEGDATVTATTTDGTNLSAQCKVHVKLLGRIWYETKELSMNIGSEPFTNPLSQEGYGITGITYSSSDENIAKVNPSTGEVTIAVGAKSGQNVTITATMSISSEVSPFIRLDDLSASYTLKLKSLTGEGERTDYTPGSW